MVAIGGCADQFGVMYKWAFSMQFPVTTISFPQVQLVGEYLHHNQWLVVDQSQDFIHLILLVTVIVTGPQWQVNVT